MKKNLNLLLNVAITAALLAWCVIDSRNQATERAALAREHLNLAGVVNLTGNRWTITAAPESGEMLELKSDTGAAVSLHRSLLPPNPSRAPAIGDRVVFNADVVAPRLAAGSAFDHVLATLEWSETGYSYGSAPSGDPEKK